MNSIERMLQSSKAEEEPSPSTAKQVEELVIQLTDLTEAASGMVEVTQGQIEMTVILSDESMTHIKRAMERNQESMSESIDYLLSDQHMQDQIHVNLVTSLVQDAQNHPQMTLMEYVEQNGFLEEFEKLSKIRLY